MLWNEALAQLKFALESEPSLKDALKKQIENDLREQGIEAVLAQVPDDLRTQIEQGQFDITVDAPSENAPDQIVLVPEGNIAEKLPITFSLSESYLSGLQDADS